jgi:hypothetical protein
MMEKAFFAEIRFLSACRKRFLDGRGFVKLPLFLSFISAEIDSGRD